MPPFRLALLMLLAAAPPVLANVPLNGRRAPAGHDGTARMARIPAGFYHPLYTVVGGAPVAVAAFALDRRAVTRLEFAHFLRTHQAWRRDQVRRVFADTSYLSDWNARPHASARGSTLDQPVTSVSWFAAKAYCAAQGKRLPTMDEWEYAAVASETTRDASRVPAFRQHLLALYASRRPGVIVDAAARFTNVYGVRGLHGVVWEWVLDFNAVVVDDDSHIAGSGAHARNQHLNCAAGAIGASDPSDYPAFLRSAVRAALTARTTLGGLGFRCAADIPV